MYSHVSIATSLFEAVRARSTRSTVLCAKGRDRARRRSLRCLFSSGLVRSRAIIEALGGLTAHGRLGSVTAAWNRAASAAKAGVGPFHRRSSTSSKRAMSVRSVAILRNSNARSCSRNSVSARALGLATFTRHSRQSRGMDSTWANLARTAADDFAPQPGRPGYPSGRCDYIVDRSVQPPRQEGNEGRGHGPKLKIWS